MGSTFLYEHEQYVFLRHSYRRNDRWLAAHLVHSPGLASILGKEPDHYRAKIGFALARCELQGMTGERKFQQQADGFCVSSHSYLAPCEQQTITIMLCFPGKVPLLHGYMVVGSVAVFEQTLKAALAQLLHQDDTSRTRLCASFGVRTAVATLEHGMCLSNTP